MRYHVWMGKSKKALAIWAWVLALPGLFSPRAQADWESLGTRWAVARDPHGWAQQINDLTYPGVLGRIVIGHVAPIAKSPHGRMSSVDWWRTVPWKTRIADAGEPMSFALNDIDFSRATRDQARFTELTERWNRQIMPKFLEHFRFVRAADGGYEVEWNNSVTPSGGPSLEVVNLRSVKSNLWKSLGQQLLEAALGEAVGLVTIPVIAGLMDVAVDRFFHWRDLMTSTREEALAEMLANPPEGFALSDGERVRAAMGILYAETMLLESPSWIWLRPGKQWSKRLASESRAASLSRAWLAKAGIYSEPMSADFDWQPPKGNFYLSGAGAPWSQPAAGPTIGLDADHPNAIFARRVSVEVATTAVIFASAWIPYIGGIQVDGFKELVEAPQDLLRGWEARMGVRLEDRECRLGEDWEPELEQLTFQQENPFEISRAQTRTLVAQRRADLGLEASHCF